MAKQAIDEQDPLADSEFLQTGTLDRRTLPVDVAASQMSAHFGINMLKYASGGNAACGLKAAMDETIGGQPWAGAQPSGLTRDYADKSITSFGAAMLIDTYWKGATILALSDFEAYILGLAQLALVMRPEALGPEKTVRVADLLGHEDPREPVSHVIHDAINRLGYESPVDQVKYMCKVAGLDVRQLGETNLKRLDDASGYRNWLVHHQTKAILCIHAESGKVAFHHTQFSERFAAPELRKVLDILLDIGEWSCIQFMSKLGVQERRISEILRVFERSRKTFMVSVTGDPDSSPSA